VVAPLDEAHGGLLGAARARALAGIHSPIGRVDRYFVGAVAHSFPDDWSDLERARQRLAFDELFIVQMGVLRQRQMWRSQPGRALNFDPAAVNGFIHSLPTAYRRATARARSNHCRLKSGVPMNRLLQGDVGSGKTVSPLPQ